MDLKSKIDLKKLPQHVAVIMDGNGRWAKKQGRLRTFGHQHGVAAVRDTAEAAAERSLAHVVVPPVPEVFTMLTCLIPMQLLTYHYALACGTNPDSFHLDDERFMRAYRMNTL